MDEPEYYCVDVPGGGTTVRLEAALQAHTCKPVAQADDQLFSLNNPHEGQIFMETYNLCVEADRSGADFYLHLKPCSDSPLQRFTYTQDGQIQLVTGTGDRFCLAVASGVGVSTRARLDDEFLPGGPNHVRRDLAIQSCGVIEPALSTWTIR